MGKKNKISFSVSLLLLVIIYLMTTYSPISDNLESAEPTGTLQKIPMTKNDSLIKQSELSFIKTVSDETIDAVQISKNYNNVLRMNHVLTEKFLHNLEP